MRRRPRHDPLRQAREVSQGRRDVGRHGFRAVGSLAVEEQCEDTRGGRGLEVVEAVVDQDAVRGPRPDRPRDLRPIRGATLVDALRMAAEDSVDQAGESRASEGGFVCLAPARGHVHAVPHPAEPLDCGSRVREARVHSGEGLPFELSGEAERVARGRWNAHPLEHLLEMARVEFVDHVPVPASVPVRFVRASCVGHEGLIVGPSPGIGISSETRREQRGQALPVSAESLLVLQEALGMMKQRVAPKDVLQRLVKADKEAARRQVGIVDARGRPASYTGKECFPWAGHLVGQHYACQGNLLAGADVVKGMGQAFERTQGDLPVRLLAALSAGQRAGGDKRGQQSAALLVVRGRGGYGGFNDRWIDVRVDDHPAPIEELVRVFNVYDVTLLDREDPKDVLPLNADVVRELQAGLTALGFYRGAASGKFDPKTKAAFEAWASVNNFENKVRSDGKVWGSVFRAFRAAVSPSRS